MYFFIGETQILEVNCAGEDYDLNIMNQGYGITSKEKGTRSVQVKKDIWQIDKNMNCRWLLRGDNHNFTINKKLTKCPAKINGPICNFKNQYIYIVQSEDQLCYRYVIKSDKWEKQKSFCTNYHFDGNYYGGIVFGITALGDYVYIHTDGNLIQRLKPSIRNSEWEYTHFGIFTETEEKCYKSPDLLAMCPLTKN